MQKFIQRMFLIALLIMPWATWSQNLILDCDFENAANDASWTFVNGDVTNAWVIGSATHNGNGSRSLYISSDTGLTYGYSEALASDVFVYQQMTLTAGMYEYTYDWTSKGEGVTDCFRMLLVPASVNLTASQIPSGLSGNSTPDSWMALDGGAKLTGEDNVWKKYQGVVNVPSDGDYKLVVYWTNDGSDKNGLPAAIDNITFGTLSCYPAMNIVASSIGSDNVTLMWDDNASTPNWYVEYGVAGFAIGQGQTYNTQTPDISIAGLSPNTFYDVYVRALCDVGDSSIATKYTFRTACGDITIPFVENFESSMHNEFPNCWFGDVEHVRVVHDSIHNNKFVEFKASGYAVSPYIPLSGDQISVSFMLKREGAQSGVMQIGFVTSLTDIDNMTPIAVINPDHNEYYDYDVDFSQIDETQEGYIVWKQVSNSSNYYYWLDSVRINMTSDCRRPSSMIAHNITHNSATLTWPSVEYISEYQVAYGFVSSPTSADAILLNVQDTTVNLTGLNGYSNYSSWVRSVCNDGNYSEWRSCNIFRTLESCAMVSSIKATTINTNGIALTWTYNEDVGNPATGAELSWRRENESTFNVVNTTNNSYFLQDLEPATTYEIMIRTFCSSENSLSKFLNVTTPPCGKVVSRGSKNTTNVPMAGYYNYSYTQMLYPACDLTGLDSIKGISLRMKSGGQTRNVNIYMGNVSQTELTNNTPIPLSSMTLVAQNVEFVLQEGWCGVQFTTPFVYDGTSNLVVAVDDNTNAYTSSDNVYYHEGSSLYIKDDDINFNPANPPVMHEFAGVADITFLSSCNTSSCAAPLLTIDQNTPSSLHLVWAPGGNETSWQVEYKQVADEDWTIESANVTDTFYTLNGLMGGTDYMVRVGAHCGGELYYSYIQTMTECSSVDVPYTEDFNAGVMDNCWTIGNSNGNGDMPEVSPLSGTLNFRDRDGGYVILPRFAVDLNTLSVRFDMMSMFSESKMVVKIGSNPRDINTFVPIDTISVRRTANYEHKLCNLMNYTGDGRYIMFHSLGRQVYMDNLSIDITPDCSTPINVTVDNIMYDGVDVMWECDNAMTQEWLIIWRAVGETDSLMESLDAMSDPIHTIIDLLPNTLYEVTVANVCLNGDTMFSIAPVSFRTACSDVEIPYLENFENEQLNVFPVCWNTTHTDSYSDDSWTHWNVPTIARADADHSLVLALSKNVNAITPRVPLEADTILVNFDLRSDDFTSTGNLVVGFSLSDTNLSEMYGVDTISLTSNDWNNFEVAFNTLDIQDTGYIVFKNINNNGVYDDADQTTYYSTLFIDNVSISGNNGCGRVSNVTVSNVTASTANITFADPNSVGNYTIGWAKTNNVATIGENSINVTTTAAQITDLEPLTRYYVWVRIDCAEGAMGNWVPAKSFITPCAAASLPYAEDFDSYTTDITSVDLAPGTYPNHTMPNCWIFQNMSKTMNALPQAYLFRSNSYADDVNCLYFRSKANTPLYAILPQFSQNISSLMISFAYRNEGLSSSNGELTLGVMTNINDTASFIAIETYPRVDRLTTIEHIFALDNALVANTDYTIAFRYMGGDYNDKALSIDNVVVEVAPSCIKPVSLALTHTTDTSVSISWRGTASSYNVEYRIAGTDTWTSIPAVATTSATITGLASLTSYEVHVQAVCSGNEVSEWSQILSFSTQCGSMSIPYSENFNGFTEDVSINTYAPETYPNHIMPTCWTFPIMGLNTPKIFLSSAPGYGFAGSKCLFFVSSDEDDAYAVLPRMSEPLNLLQIDFKYRNESSSDLNGELSIGVMTNPVDTTTFIELETYPIFGGIRMAEHAFSLDDQIDANTDYYIAFRYHGVRNNYYLSLDDIVVDYAPSCLTPTTLEVVDADATSATIGWEGNATQYEVNYRLISNSTWQHTTVTTNQCNLTGLEAMKEYKVRVRAICSATDTSEWSDVFNFTTSCAAYTLPFFEDFNELSTSTPTLETLSCWNIYTGLLNADGTAQLSPSTYAWDWSATRQLNNGAQSMYIEIESNDVKGWLITPEIHIAASTTLEFNLGRREPFSGNDVWDADDRFVVLISTDQGANWTTLQSWTGATYQSIPVYTTPAQEVSIDLDQYADQTVRIAFYGESTVASGSDHYIHIDDVRVASADLCPLPSHLSANNITPVSAELSWQHGAHSFDLDYRAQEATEWSSVTSNITITSHTLTGLQPNTTYEWRVRANCSATDTSDWVMSTFTTEELVCNKPTNLQANAAYTSATLSWTDADHTSWEVMITGGANDINQTVTTNPATIDNLTMGTTYQAKVRALCAEGIYSEWSDVVSFTTDNCLPVLNVTVSDVYENSAKISWIAGGEESEWEVMYGEKDFLSGEGNTIIAHENNYTIKHLAEGTTYDVYVRSACHDGMFSAWSARCQFTTKGTPAGIDGIDGQFNFAIYPNPTHGATTISLMGVEGAVVISVVDLNGRTIVSESLECGESCEKRLDVTGLAQGTYFVRVVGDNINSVRKLIVK